MLRTLPSPLSIRLFSKGYQWLKDKILSEEGRRQQAKLKELQAIAERLGCTLPQLAIGKRTTRHKELPRELGLATVLCS